MYIESTETDALLQNASGKNVEGLNVIPDSLIQNRGENKRGKKFINTSNKEGYGLNHKNTKTNAYKN